MTNETAMIDTIVPGDPRRAQGHVTMIENTVDTVTGTVPAQPWRTLMRCSGRALVMFG
jgi:hypothetical protein